MNRSKPYEAMLKKQPEPTKGIRLLNWAKPLLGIAFQIAIVFGIFYTIFTYLTKM